MSKNIFRTHSAAELVAAQRDLYTECAAFVLEYPHFCRNCGAEGAIEYTENGAPHGAGFWPMQMSEPCPDCSDKGICPLCGSSDSWEELTESCKSCGWQMDAPADIFPGTKRSLIVLQQFFIELKGD